MFKNVVLNFAFISSALISNHIAFATEGENPTSSSATLQFNCDDYLKRVKSMTSDESYLVQLRSECQIINDFKKIRSRYADKFQLPLTHISEYQSMRFIRRINYEHAKTGSTPTGVQLGQEIPPQKLYQLKKTLDGLPLNERSTVTWDNWAQGIKQVDTYVERVKRFQGFDFDDLKRVHKGFFQLSNEVGDFSHVPDEGIIKPAVPNDNYWWPFNTDTEAQAAKDSIAVSNKEFERAGLVDMELDPEFRDALRIKYVEKMGATPDADGNISMVWAIYSGDSRANRTHVDFTLKFFNEVITSLKNGQPINRNGWLLTPLQAAYLMQKFYVGVHPFSEGNGRTSRFLQELLLVSIDAPHGSSGDLMDEDVLSTFESYYQKAMSGQIQVLEKIKSCENEYRNAFWGLNLDDISPESAVERMVSKNDQLSFSCKILK